MEDLYDKIAAAASIVEVKNLLKNDDGLLPRIHVIIKL
jgi:hypothetical protein